MTNLLPAPRCSWSHLPRSSLKSPIGSIIGRLDLASGTASAIEMPWKCIKQIIPEMEIVFPMDNWQDQEQCTCGARPVRPGQTVHQHGLSSVNDVIDELQHGSELAHTWSNHQYLALWHLKSIILLSVSIILCFGLFILFLRNICRSPLSLPITSRLQKATSKVK